MRISVIGGTGYAGSNIVTEAIQRGHEVNAWARSAPKVPIPGAKYQRADISDPQALKTAVDGADVVVCTLSPRGDLEGQMVRITKQLEMLCVDYGARLGMMGGAGTLDVKPGGPRLYESEGFPAAFLPESTEMGKVIDELRSADPALDWFAICPARDFGARTGGERTGKYRAGGHELLFDAEGHSRLSGADLAVAFLDEIENPAHHNDYFAVAY